MEVPQMTKNRIIIWCSIFTSGYIFEEKENINSKRYIHHNDHNNIIYNRQDMEATLVSINIWMNKEYIVYIKYFKAWNSVIWLYISICLPLLYENMAVWLIIS